MRERRRRGRREMSRKRRRKQTKLNQSNTFIGHREVHIKIDYQQTPDQVCTLLLLASRVIVALLIYQISQLIN